MGERTSRKTASLLRAALAALGAFENMLLIQVIVEFLPCFVDRQLYPWGYYSEMPFRTRKVAQYTQADCGNNLWLEMSVTRSARGTQPPSDDTPMLCQRKIIRGTRAGGPEETRGP